MHILVLMLYRKFWADSNQNWIFYEFKFAQKLDQNPCTKVHGFWPNLIKNEKMRILKLYYIF